MAANSYYVTTNYITYIHPVTRALAASRARFWLQLAGFSNDYDIVVCHVHIKAFGAAGIVDAQPVPPRGTASGFPTLPGSISIANYYVVGAQAWPEEEGTFNKVELRSQCRYANNLGTNRFIM